MLTSARTTNILLIGVIAIGIGIIGMLATVARGGPLDPDAAPNPTMKTLDEIPGSWSHSLPADDGIPIGQEDQGCNSTRFQCVLVNNEGVLDRETGLVWARGTTGSGNWAGSQCTSSWGGVYGWRLPTVAEINSLVDDSGSPLYLPAGHPFTGIHPTDHYWTSTPDKNSNSAITRTFDGSGGTQDYATGVARSWCVRGPE